MKRRHTRIEGKSAPKQSDGLGVLSGLKCNDRQLMKRIQMLGMVIQDHPIELRRFLQPTGPMMLDRYRERMLKYRRAHLWGNLPGSVGNGSTHIAENQQRRRNYRLL